MPWRARDPAFYRAFGPPIAYSDPKSRALSCRANPLLGWGSEQTPCASPWLDHFCSRRLDRFLFLPRDGLVSCAVGGTWSTSTTSLACCRSTSASESSVPSSELSCVGPSGWLRFGSSRETSLLAAFRTCLSKYLQRASVSYRSRRGLKSSDSRAKKLCPWARQHAHVEASYKG
jgi:hypothetical protein